MQVKIKTYKGKLVHQAHFFILNKGMNCGKPLFQPCANCFVLLAETEKEKEFYYWLCFALWQTKKFEPYLIGSVIPFIHIADLKTVIVQAKIKADKKPKQYQKSLTLLIDIDKKSKVLAEQLKLISELKKSILNKVLQ